MIDDRTSHLDLPLPHASNRLAEDVARLREALTALDTLLGSDDPALDTTQEIVAAIKAAKANITALAGQITAGDAALAGQIAAGDSALAGQITAGDAALAGQITAGDSALAGQIATKEPLLGDPVNDGFVLSSTAEGVRSWIRSVSSTKLYFMAGW